MFGIVAVIFCIVSIITNDRGEEPTEYVPQEEISEEQERQTLVTLYFQNKETKMLMPEARLIDAKKLIDNPYETLINLLLDGPKNEKLQSIIPTGTKLNKVIIQGNIAVVDLSENFVKEIKAGAEEESKIVYSIVNTLVELTEIDGVKILINGKESEGFPDGAIKFDEAFVKVD